VRERAELVAERVGLVNRIGAVLATLGVGEYNPLRRDRRQRLDELRTALGGSLPTHARAKIVRMLDRLELLLIQITELEKSRDAVLEDENPDKAASMIQQLAKLRGVGVQSATVLVREGFVREFANGKALGSYAGLTSTPYSSGGTEREQGIGKAGNVRLRTLMVELAWLWLRPERAKCATARAPS
jgi:transposase